MQADDKRADLAGYTLKSMRLTYRLPAGLQRPSHVAEPVSRGRGLLGLISSSSRPCCTRRASKACRTAPQATGSLLGGGMIKKSMSPAVRVTMVKLDMAETWSKWLRKVLSCLFKNGTQDKHEGLSQCRFACVL